MTEQQIKVLFLGIDQLISQRINNNGLQSFEEFTDTRERIVEQVTMAMKIKDEPIKPATQERGEG